jgi:hypothetical protein
VLRVSGPLNAEDLFRTYFFPLYPPDARTSADLARARVTDANPGGNRFILAHIDDAADRFIGSMNDLFGEDLCLDRSDASVHRLSASLTRERRDAWAARGGAAGSPGNVLFNSVVHGSAYVGSCVVARHGAAWSVRRPLWESVVRLTSRAGQADLAVFHWWLKSLADDGQGTTLADRYRAHVEVPCARPEDLARFVVGDRALPRLQKPRYDLVHKYLRAHLPELRDLGEHFPSPERFEAFSLRWMDFFVIGDGRMVLMAGAAQEGLHLFWLSGAGFDKSAFFRCDAFPDPVVRVEKDRILVMMRESGQERIREMLWWGL